MASSECIKILQWNIRSIRSNIDNLKYLINKFNIDIILLNETMLKEEVHIRLSGYDILRKDRDDGLGGIAMFIRNNIEFENYEIRQNLLPWHVQIQACNIKKCNVNLINMYIPPEIRIEKQTLETIWNLIPNPKLILGDLNAQHPTWGSSINNRNGNLINNLIADSNFVILNNGSPTRLTPPNQNISAPDLTFGSPQLALKSSWTVIQDCGNSDHFPILIEIGVNENCRIPQSKAKRNFKKADWCAYHDKVLINHLEAPVTDYEKFVQCINKAASESIPLKEEYKGNKNNRGPTPWWDPECNDLIQERKNAIRNLQDNFNMENYIETKKIIARVRKKFKIKKKTSFQKFCSDLNRSTPVNKIWKTTKKFNNVINKTNKKTFPTEDVAQNILDNLNIVNLEPEFQLDTPNNNREFRITVGELNYILNTKKAQHLA